MTHAPFTSWVSVSLLFLLLNYAAWLQTGKPVGSWETALASNSRQEGNGQTGVGVMLVLRPPRSTSNIRAWSDDTDLSPTDQGGGGGSFATLEAGPL